MPLPGRSKLFPALAFLLGLSAAAALLAQNLALSPSPSPTLSPTPTASPPPTVPQTASPTPTPLPGAQNFHQWGSITVFNGLPSDSVRAIAQTPDGVMWFGTDNGLARFDGRRVQNFSLGNDNADKITTLEVSASGELWIGTRAGAFVYADTRFQPIDGTQGLGITSILLYGEKYLGTDGGLVMTVSAGDGGSFNAAQFASKPLTGPDGKALAVSGLVVQQGKLLAATAGSGVFEVTGRDVSEFPTAPGPLFVNALATSGDQLWLGSDAAKGASGIYLKEETVRADRIPAPTANVLAIEANDGGLWAGTERYGLFHVTDSKLKKAYTFENTSGGLRSDTIYSLFTDREGVLWIGTNRGVSRFDRLGPVQETVSDSPNGNFIRTLFKASDGKIYAGSNRGLFVRDDDKWEPVAAYGNKPIYALSEDRAGKLVVGSNERINQTTNDVRSFADFQGMKYGAVAGLGLAQVNNGVYSLRHADGAINALCSDQGRVLWIGTAGNGLFSFDGRDVKLEVPPDILKAGMIWRIRESVDTSVWIAGEHGIFEVLNSNEVEKVIEAEDARDVFIYGGDVWAATTTRGLVHATRDEGFGWLVASVGFEQGLPSEKAFSILRVDEGLLIATNRGVVTYKPGSITPKLIPTRIISQRVHDLSEARTSIDLEYPQNSVLVEVAGQSSRTFPEEFQYGFVLKNAKGEILDKRISNEPQYAPADLKAGNYAIEAIAFDRDLLASDPLVINFSVAKAPFPWTSAALAALLAIAVIALIWAIVERRRIVIRNRELAAARLDLANEAERERSRIARDLHDQTLADLRGLIMKSDKELPPDAGFREEIESISTEVRRICEDLSPSVLENVGLRASLEFLVARTFENHTFESGENTDENIRFPMNVQLQIYRIAQEVLANIKQHAEATLVGMRVSASDSGRFEMVIENDGLTFTPPEHNLRGGRGIAGIRSRAALINANVEWREVSGKRQIFVLTLDQAG